MKNIKFYLEKKKKGPIIVAMKILDFMPQQTV